jgi:hypothetical protein
MANRQLKDLDPSPSSVWEIPVSELPDRASEVWGRCPDKHHGEVTTNPSPPQQKVRQMEPSHRPATDRAATAGV